MQHFSLRAKIRTSLQSPSGERQMTMRFTLVGSMYGTCFLSPFGRLEFGCGSEINFMVVILLYLNINANKYADFRSNTTIHFYCNTATYFGLLQEHHHAVISDLKNYEN